MIHLLVARLIQLVHLVDLNVGILHARRVDQMRARIGSILQHVRNQARLHLHRTVLHVWRHLVHRCLVSNHKPSAGHGARAKSIPTVRDYHSALIDVRYSSADA